MGHMMESLRGGEDVDRATAACFAGLLSRTSDDAYMGYATREQLAAFLNELLEPSARATGVALKAPGGGGRKFAELLRDVHATRRAGAPCF
jgi:hypothetical protein